MILPALTPKLYAALVNEIVATKVGPERTRLSALQRQLSEALQTMAASKTIDVWAKAG